MRVVLLEVEPVEDIEKANDFSRDCICCSNPCMYSSRDDTDGRLSETSARVALVCRLRLSYDSRADDLDLGMPVEGRSDCPVLSEDSPHPSHPEKGPTTAMGSELFVLVVSYHRPPWKSCCPRHLCPSSPSL
jgi:hypothetical protein